MRRVYVTFRRTPSRCFCSHTHTHRHTLIHTKHRTPPHASIAQRPFLSALDIHAPLTSRPIPRRVRFAASRRTISTAYVLPLRNLQHLEQTRQVIILDTTSIADRKDVRRLAAGKAAEENKSGMYRYSSTVRRRILQSTSMIVSRRPFHAAFPSLVCERLWGRVGTHLIGITRTTRKSCAPHKRALAFVSGIVT